jgi:hypothetical protein
MPRPELRGALPALQRADDRLTALARQRGITYGIADFGGVRSEADTTRILNYRDVDYRAYVAALKKSKPLAVPVSIDRFRPISPFGVSFHNWGGSFDVKILSHPATMTAAQALVVLQQLAPTAGLVSGATFPKPDAPHMQLPITLAEAKRQFQALGGRAGVPLAYTAGAAGVLIVAALGLIASRVLASGGRLA